MSEKSFSAAMANVVDKVADSAYLDGKRDGAEDAAATIARQSALLAQMAGAVTECRNFIRKWDGDGKQVERADAALTAYAASSPDPQWQRVPEGCVVVPEHLSDGLLMQVGTMANYEPASDTADKDHRDWWTDVLHTIDRARGER